MDLGTWRPTAHDRDGELCRCCECAPPVTISLYEARASTDRRKERDLQTARWRRLRPDEVLPFLNHLRLYDLRAEERELQAATEAVVCARLDADLADFWLRNGEPEEPRGPVSHAPPRIYTPRITTPRL